jgi:predicted membrane protein
MEVEEKNKRSRKGIFTGLVIVAIGVIWLLREMNLHIPYWIFDWYSWVILAGVSIGFGSGFRKPASWILILVGVVFLIDDVFFIPIHIRDYFWPVMVIVIGLLVLIRPKKEPILNHENWDGFSESGDKTSDLRNRLDLVSIFNGIKKSVISKNFGGGETVTIFGGTEINLTQADFSKPVVIEAVVVFGGLKLIVPPTWEVQTDVTSILASVDDKRVSAVQVIQEDKILILHGTVVFGGIDIINY